MKCRPSSDSINDNKRGGICHLFYCQDRTFIRRLQKLANDDDISENTAAVKALPSQQDDSSENTAVKALPSQQDDNSEAKFTEHILACQKAMTNGDFNEAQLYCDLARDISPNDPRYLALNEQLRKEIDSQNALSDVLKNLSNGECRNAVNALDNIQKGTFAYTTMLEKDYKTKARECFEKAPTPTQNSNETNKGKCDTQTISKEKHLPKWNIEIIDSSVIASMLKDAEKNHLPFLKINASDNLKQKLETYINKDPSKLNPDFKNAFTCTLDDYIRTSSNIGIQLVYCSDHENLVVFLNLVSPVDNKARVYQAKIFDRLFEDAPAIVKTEQTEINGERGVYVAVKYIDYSDGTGTEHEETDIVHYLFLGDKLRYLTDWNAFHIEESREHNDDGTEEYSCDAKATILRLESTGAKHQEHTFSISTSN